MYPAFKGMDAVHSGTGVFYQAMPAVGADGKNIMKLIPVQMVNGQFVHTQMSKPQTDPKPQKAVTINIASAPVQMVKKAALNPNATQQVVRNQVSLVNALPNQVGLDLRNALNKHPLQQQTVNVMAKLPLLATHATHCDKSVSFLNHLPVTVKSPALPRGQYLQIPPHAQVRKVPASELPPGIKEQIFMSSPSSSPGSGSPSVIYVSPVTTVNQGVTPPSDSALHSLKLLSKTSNKTLCGSPSRGSKRQLKLVPKVSQRPNSPIKWMIEEEDSSAVPSLDPLNSPSITSEILSAVAERENASKHCDVMTKPVSPSSQAKIVQGQENALVMCNGKVFFVAKKCSLPFKTGKNDSPAAAATKTSESNKTIPPSSQRPLETISPDLRQDLRIVIDESDEVIDLCDDDDAEDESSQQAAFTHLDEDNVIFVSYIPPKSESGSGRQDSILKTQTALVKETEQAGTSSNSVTKLKSPDGTTGGDDRGRTPDQSVLDTAVRNLTHVCGSAVMNVCENEDSNIIDVDVETESPAGPSTSDSSREICSQIEQDPRKMESSVNPATSWACSLAPKSSQMADHLLRQIFKITADVKICLQRIDEASAGSVPADPAQSESIKPVEEHQEPTSGSKDKELFLQEHYSPQETDSEADLVSVQRIKVPSEQNLPTDRATLSSHTHSEPLKCSHVKVNTNPLSALKCNSGQSLFNGTSCDVETEPVILSYVEPIDEDFLSADQNDILNSQDSDIRTQTPTCVDLNTNTSRMGRTRKRTICPCCIPGAQVPAVKSSTKPVEPEMWAWTTEKTSKKGERTKAVRKDVKTSGRISCFTAKNKQKCKAYEVPARDSLSTTSMDFDELKRNERIRRLKELLREKEAALEVMRNSMS